MEDLRGTDLDQHLVSSAELLGAKCFELSDQLIDRSDIYRSLFCNELRKKKTPMHFSKIVGLFEEWWLVVAPEPPAKRLALTAFAACTVGYRPVLRAD